MSHDIKSAERPAPDPLLAAIADYALSFAIKSDLAYETAGYCLMDTLACGFQALKYPACTKLMGPVVPGATLKGGARVPGTSYELDPINAAFNIGAMIRWLDFNDTWLAAEWGHPSDNLGGILAVADYLSRGGKPVDRARRAHGHDQGARDSRRARAREQLQSGRARPRAAGARRIHRRGHGHARRHARSDHQRRLERLGRRRRAAHLSPRAEYRIAQELGGRRCDQPRRAPRAFRAQGGDGLSVRALGQDMGIPGRSVQVQAARSCRRPSAAT